jgi:hypothetical protein
VSLSLHVVAALAPFFAELPAFARALAVLLVAASAIWHSRGVMQSERSTSIRLLELDPPHVRALRGDGRWLHGLRITHLDTDFHGVRIGLGGDVDIDLEGELRIAWNCLDAEQVWAVRRLVRRYRLRSADVDG